MGIIHFIEQNIHGAWVIYGALGVRQYDGYTKSQAVAKYKEECKKNLFYNEGGSKNDDERNAGNASSERIYID